MPSMQFTLTSESNLQVDAFGPLNLSADETERLIDELAKFRRKMKPEVPRQIPNGQRDGMPVDPIWLVQQFVDQRVLGIRHPGIGWLLFLLPEAEAKKLGGALLQSVPQQAGQPTATDRRH